jgi:hypothetical protein
VSRPKVCKEYHVADFETTGEVQYNRDGYTRVYLYYIENVFNDEEADLGVDIESFMSYALRQPDKVTKRTIFFHNLGLDVLFIEYYLLNHGYTCTFEEGEKTYQVIRDDMNNVFALNIVEGNLVLSFHDSLKLLQVSVDQLPNERGLEKLKGYDYKKIRDEKTLDDFSSFDIEYVKHDVWKVKDVLRALLPLIGDHLTIASSSFADWLEIFSEGDKWKYKNYFPHIKPEIEEKLRRAYNGGIVMLNERYHGVVINSPLVSFDVNSLFSATMYFDPLPYGKPHIIVTEDNKDRLVKRGFDLFVYNVTVDRMTIKEGFHPFISKSKHYTFRRKESFPDVIEDTVFMWSSVDLAMVEKYYDIEYEIDFRESYAFKSRTDIFTKYIDKYMTMKMMAKNIFERMFAKYRLNTLYGKFGTRRDRMSKISKLVDGKIEFEGVISESKRDYYLPIAIFITAHARKRLIETIQAERRGFVYGDTDSIHALKRHFIGDIDIDPKRLGAWKNEGEAIRSIFISNKQYLKEKVSYDYGVPTHYIERKIASMSKTSHHKVNFDNAYQGSVIKGGKKNKKHVIGGYIIVDGDFTFT